MARLGSLLVLSRPWKGWKLPKKYEGTWVDRLVTYWRSLFRDYGEAGRDFIKDAKERPLRSIGIASLLGAATLCAKRNPDEQSYRDRLVEAQTDLASISSSIQNRGVVRRVRYLEDLYNNGQLRYFSFGLFSVVWAADYNERLGLYEARSDFLKPSWTEMLTQRVLDVGVLGHWLQLERETADFDVNEEEWSQH